MYWCTFTEDKEISAATKFGKLHSLECSNQTEIMHCVFHWSTQYHLVVRFTCQHSTTWWSDSPINTVPHGGQVNQLTPYTWWSDSPVNTVHMVVRFTSRHSTHGGQIHQSTQYHMVVRFISQRSTIWRSE